MERKYMLSAIANTFGLEIIGDDVEINGLNLCNRQSEYDSVLSYVTNGHFVNDVKGNTKIKALILSQGNMEYYSDKDLGRNITYIVSECPEDIFYRIHIYLYENTDFYNKYIFEKVIGDNCRISKSAYIEDGVIIGNRVVIGHNSTIRSGSIIEDDTVIGCNTVVGSEGFQSIKTSNGVITIPHVGGCHISRSVTIGDNNCVCNSLFEGSTYVGESVKTDNMVHIAHNSYIEKNVTLTAGVTLCGTVTIREGAWIAPNTSILNKVTIGKNARTGLGSVVVRNVPDGALVYGVPAREHTVE